MEILKDISLLWALFHTLVVFLLLFESRYSRKKTIILTAVTMAPLCIINLALFTLLGSDTYSALMLLTLSLPSCIVFWLLAKYRDGRFFFTFCMVDTVMLEIIYVTNILNHYLTPDSYIVMFVMRMVSIPLLVLWVIKCLRPMYVSIQKYAKAGWWSFAAIGALMYVIIILLMTYPEQVTQRPDYLPALILVFILMPLIYANIIQTLGRLHSFHEQTSQENILSLQVSALTARMEELAAADQKFRMERHNYRHKMKTIASLLETEQYDECRAVLAEYNEALSKTTVKRYCQHPVLDAVLSAYISKAQSSGIRTTFGIAFPDELGVNAAELATAIANALENAINACEKLPPDRRKIDIKILDRPRLIIKITNSYEGHVEFDQDGIPVNAHDDHGFGTRFIAAFCNKNDGFYAFQADGENFTLFINL